MSPAALASAMGEADYISVDYLLSQFPAPSPPRSRPSGPTAPQPSPSAPPSPRFHPHSLPPPQPQPPHDPAPKTPRTAPQASLHTSSFDAAEARRLDVFRPRGKQLPQQDACSGETSAHRTQTTTKRDDKKSRRGQEAHGPVRSVEHPTADVVASSFKPRSAAVDVDTLVPEYDVPGASVRQKCKMRSSPPSKRVDGMHDVLIPSDLAGYPPTTTAHHRPTNLNASTRHLPSLPEDRYEEDKPFVADTEEHRRSKTTVESHDVPCPDQHQRTLLKAVPHLSTATATHPDLATDSALQHTAREPLLDNQNAPQKMDQAQDHHEEKRSSDKVRSVPSTICPPQQQVTNADSPQERPLVSGADGIAREKHRWGEMKTRIALLENLILTSSYPSCHHNQPEDAMGHPTSNRDSDHAGHQQPSPIKYADNALLSNPTTAQAGMKCPDGVSAPKGTISDSCSSNAQGPGLTNCNSIADDRAGQAQKEDEAETYLLQSKIQLLETEIELLRLKQGQGHVYEQESRQELGTGAKKPFDSSSLGCPFDPFRTGPFHPWANDPEGHQPPSSFHRQPLPDRELSFGPSPSPAALPYIKSGNMQRETVQARRAQRAQSQGNKTRKAPPYVQLHIQPLYREPNEQESHEPVYVSRSVKPAPFGGLGAPRQPQKFQQSLDFSPLEQGHGARWFHGYPQIAHSDQSLRQDPANSVAGRSSFGSLREFLPDSNGRNRWWHLPFRPSISSAGTDTSGICSRRDDFDSWASSTEMSNASMSARLSGERSSSDRSENACIRQGILLSPSTAQAYTSTRVGVGPGAEARWADPPRESADGARKSLSATWRHHLCPQQYSNGTAPTDGASISASVSKKASCETLQSSDRRCKAGCAPAASSLDTCDTAGYSPAADPEPSSSGRAVAQHLSPDVAANRGNRSFHTSQTRGSASSSSSGNAPPTPSGGFSSRASRISEDDADVEFSPWGLSQAVPWAIMSTTAKSRASLSGTFKARSSDSTEGAAFPSAGPCANQTPRRRDHVARLLRSTVSARRTENEGWMAYCSNEAYTRPDGQVKSKVKSGVGRGKLDIVPMGGDKA